MVEMPAARDSLLDLFLPLSRFLFTPYAVALASGGAYSARVIRNVWRRRELARYVSHICSPAKFYLIEIYARAEMFRGKLLLRSLRSRLNEDSSP